MNEKEEFGLAGELDELEPEIKELDAELCLDLAGEGFEPWCETLYRRVNAVRQEVKSERDADAVKWLISKYNPSVIG